MSTPQTPPVIPDGFYGYNALGHLVPIDAVAEFDKLRDELVKNSVAQAVELQKKQRDFKYKMLGDIAAFIELSAEQYNVYVGGKKGNLSLLSFDGKRKIQLAIARNIAFDEKIHTAKTIIDECLHRWTENSNVNLKAIVDHAFRVDTKGSIDTARVLSLFNLKINDDRWQEAMRAIKDSITPAGSKEYVRFYERRGEENKFEQISLDFSGL